MSDQAESTIRQLAKVVADGECVLFLGNDLPLGYPGAAPPCREELAGELARDLKMPPPAPGSLGTLALLYEGDRGRHALVRRVRELLDKPAYLPATLHHQVAALPFQAILTTAQDRLLERALDAAGRAYATVQLIHAPGLPCPGASTGHRLHPGGDVGAIGGFAAGDHPLRLLGRFKCAQPKQDWFQALSDALDEGGSQIVTELRAVFGLPSDYKTAGHSGLFLCPCPAGPASSAP